MTRRIAVRTALALPLGASLQPAVAVNYEPTTVLIQSFDTEPTTVLIPQNPGPEPKDIGIQRNRGTTLKPCTRKPICLSSSTGLAPSDDLTGSDYRNLGWLVDPFKYNIREKSLAEAFAEIRGAVAAYQPGQRGIDGGGFKVVRAGTDGKVAYVYAQFKSTQGYIDDVEFAMSNGVCNVRTASRVGETDSGVNAKRYEWFSSVLRDLGWKTEPLRREGHTDYFDENRLTDSDMTQF